MSLLGETWDNTFVYMWQNGIIRKYLTRVLIVGASRSGKSTLIHDLTGSYRQTFFEAMPLEDMIGGMSPNPNAHKGEPPFVWVDGPVIKAMREGKPYQPDELHEIPRECQTVLYAVMDKPAAVTLPSGERVKAKDGFCVIATTNPSPAELPHPVYDRIDCILRADQLSKGIKDYLGPQLTEIAERNLWHGQQPLTWKRPITVNCLLAFKALKNGGISDEDAAVMLGFKVQEVGDFLTIIAPKARKK